MTRNEFYILNTIYNASKGRAKTTMDLGVNEALADGAAYDRLIHEGYIDRADGSLTQAGIEALAPYKVDNAVILAAGSATRFIPLSLEQPKGLYEVRGEKLIERQIRQLLDAGITDITIVLGYKKEMFSYLADTYPVKFIINPAYNRKNNIESLYLARKELKNTYVCVCDSYFIENPFNAYEYEPFYAGYDTDVKEEEMYVTCDENHRILVMEHDRDKGKILLGHTFWTKEFSEKFLKLAEADQKEGIYNDSFWEEMVKDHLQELPPYYFKEYAREMIHEFDYFEQLRDFDSRYVSRSHSEIIRNIKLVFRCDEEDVVDFRTVNEGMTNTSFIFKIDGVDYIYRHPGDGTEHIISRKNEKRSLIQAKAFGLDPTYIYMDVNEGWKISKYVHHFREPDYDSFDDSKRVIRALQKLHSLPVKTDYGMKPWEDALAMEQMIRSHDGNLFAQHEPLKEAVGKLYERTLGDGVPKCFCHGDTYKPNWMLTDDGGVILIDWEYAGYSDPGIDVGYYIVDAMYDFGKADAFIREYLGDTCTDKRYFHFMAYVAIIAYYWFVWAMYRESCGANMGEALENWRIMAERYATHAAKI